MTKLRRIAEALSSLTSVALQKFGHGVGLDNGRGRVLLYQYKEDEEVWQPLASPIEGEVEEKEWDTT